MMLQNIFLAPYKKGVAYKMLSVNTDSYKCVLLVGKLNRGYFRKKSL